MRCFARLTVIFGLSLTLVGCQSSPRVQAAREDAALANRYGQGPISGDLHSVDLADKTIVIRVENGMAQTFRWDEDTVIDGDLPPMEPKSSKGLFETGAVMKRLSRRPGSELNVEWRNVKDEKLATAVHVTNLGPQSSQKLRRKKSHAK